MGRLATATRVLRTEGSAGVLSAFKDRYLNNWLGRQIDWCYGKALELRGNAIEIEGCVFGLDSPAITTPSKSKFMFGRYERPEREAIRRFVDPALPVIEFGGSIGVIACLTNRRLLDPKAHVVVEANPTLVPLLVANRDRNRCQFTVLARVVGYSGERALFYADRSNFVIGSTVATQRGSGGEVLEVETTDLRSILDQRNFDRVTLICDIEGGEADLLRYEADVIGARVVTLILEVHEWSMGKSRTAECLKEIADLGFRSVFSEADTYVFKKGQ